MLKVIYKTPKLEKNCTVYSLTKRKYGENMAKLIHQRIQEIKAADAVEMLVQFGVGRCHPLNGKREGTYAMELGQPYRLIFEKVKDEIRIVRILEIEDYH